MFSFRNIHNVRLSPKHSQNEKYEFTGIAGLCDWQVIIDSQIAELHVIGYLLHRNEIIHPRTIFLCTKGGFGIFDYFLARVLPKIHKQFVLISGSADYTIPRQIDLRFPKSSLSQKITLECIRSDSNLIAWFAENLDSYRPKMQFLPTGYTFDGSGAPISSVKTSDISIFEKNLKVFCGHRIRDGSQWDTRKKVSNLCKYEWSSLTTLIEKELSLDEYIANILDHPFILCVEGGGLDPSPKAWLAMAAGSIPIIRRSPLAEAYEQVLPVSVIEDWEPSLLTSSVLEQWLEKLRPWFQNDDGRMKIEYRLSIHYWWHRILAELDRGGA